MRKWIRLLWVFWLCPVAFVTAMDLSQPNIVEVAPGVYAGQTVVGQEVVYFGMERLDSDNQSKWRKYAHYCDARLSGDRGVLYVISALISKNREMLPFNESLKNVTGFQDEEGYKAYVKKIERIIQKNPKLPMHIRGVPSGATGFFPSDDGTFYVVYASKTPITGRFAFPDKLMQEGYTLKDFYTDFSDLLISVGSRCYPKENHYRNRGIFRNPVSIIEDGNRYPGLSMKLHAFSAIVMKHLFPEKEFMKVEPVPTMARIIVNQKGWKPGDVTIIDKDLFNYTPEELDIKLGIDTPFTIKIEALMGLFGD